MPRYRGGVELEERVAALERRLDALTAHAGSAEAEAEPAHRLPPSAPGTWWLLEHLGPGEESGGAVGGSLAYGGAVRSPGVGEVAWQLEHTVQDVLDLDAGAVAGVLAALGSPVRVELVRRMLLGASTLAELQSVPGARTTGQVHHHLRELRAAGLVTASRNSFHLVPARVVPVLVAIAAAAGPPSPPAPPEGDHP